MMERLNLRNNTGNSSKFTLCLVIRVVYRPTYLYKWKEQTL